jgi:hypothetical protein
MAAHLTLDPEPTAAEVDGSRVYHCDRCSNPLKGFGTRLSIAQVGRYELWILCLRCARRVEQVLEPAVVSA